MAAENSEARELSLVGKVEMRIAMVSTDEKLQSMLATYLAPLLLKLSSEHVGVRNKVISVCQHINTRIKPPSIQLPVAILLKQYKDTMNPLIRHFDLLYIAQGVDRLPVKERLDLLPTLLHGLPTNYDESPTSAATLYNLLLRLLHSMKLPPRGTKEDLELRSQLGLDEHEEDALFVATWLGKLILLSTSQPGTERCAGLSSKEYGFLTVHGKKDVWDSASDGGLNLVETKVIVSKFLASGAFIDSERYLPALIMSGDLNSRIADTGDDVLKRATSAVSFEDQGLIKELYRIYLGTRASDGSLPARPSLQVKILAILCKSKLASSFVEESTQIVKEALAPQDRYNSFNGTSLPSNDRTLKPGLESSKLRTQVFAFTNWLARISSPDDIKCFAPDLVAQLRNYIEDQGWPRPRTDEAMSAGEAASRAYGYESIGLLAGACANDLLLEPNLDLLRWLFTSLSEDPSGNEISISIEQALSSVLTTLGGNLDLDLETSLMSLFLHHMSLHPAEGEISEGPIRSTRFVAVRFANRCLPYHNVEARWIDLLAMSGDAKERNEVIEEGRKGLDPYWHRMLNPSKMGSSTTDPGDTAHDFPNVKHLVNRFFGSESGWHPSQLDSPHIARAYIQALTFCRCLLLHEGLRTVGHAPPVDAEWERHIDALILNNEDARSGLRARFDNLLSHDLSAQRTVKVYLHACFSGMISSGGRETGRAGEFLIEICSLIPTAEYADLAARVEDLQEPISSNEKVLRERSAHVFGLLSSLEECSPVSRDTMLKSLETKYQAWRTAIGSEVVQAHGAILATAYYLSRATRRSSLATGDTELRVSFTNVLVNVLSETKDKILQEATFSAISELALFGVLTPFSIAPAKDVSEVENDLVKNSKEGKEKAIIALGHLAMQCEEEESEESLLTRIIIHLCDLHTVRQAEVQFAIGAALACAACGWESKSLTAAIDTAGPIPQSAVRKNTLSIVVERVLLDCKTSKPALRQASVIWLLCLVQYCGHLPDIQRKLRDCQVAFRGFLADRDSLNQESASRGLTIVYEKGARDLKDDLIRDLVSSFTGTTSNLAGGKISEDTELFDAGALPTGDGSITTYKDIMSLAAEVGDSSLVYRFMSLASNNAIWSSRAAFGRFGLSSILSDASTDGYLAQNPKLYPALFRYRFDPNTNVRNSMNEIWGALVKEPTVTINMHFDTIMDDLLKNILGKEWRVRQASCAAIADLIQGRPLEMYEKYLSKIWDLTFKVCDDIKESVRAAAMALARVLTGILVRGLEAGDSGSKTADKMLKLVLPFLLSPSGLESGAPEVQNFARKTILEIIKKANGKTLRPFVPELVGRLLALLSSIEPEMINYVHLNAEKYGVTAEQLDDARLKHIRGSTMLEAIERCLDFLDEHSMPALQQSLDNAIKTVIGLPSKVGCSRVLVSLSTRQNFIFKPYADAFLPLARKQVFDRNDTISSSYATACGHLARLTSDKALLTLVESCRKLYFDSDDDRHRVFAGDIIYAFSKYATDRFNALAGDILPFVFVAKHDIYEKARLLFEDTWNENVGGSRAVLLYLSEIVQLASQYLESARWSIKHTSAFAIADVVTSSGTGISEPSARAIWPALEKALAGKTWDGKEKVLNAFIVFAKNSPLTQSDYSLSAQIEKIVLREAKRNNATYRQHAVRVLGDFVELRKGLDMYDQTHDIIAPIINELSSKSQEEMDVDSSSGGASSKTVNESTLANAARALLQSINPLKRQNDKLVTALEQTLSLLQQADGSGSASRSLQIAIFEQLNPLFDRIRSSPDRGSTPVQAQLKDVLVKYTQKVFTVSDQVEQVRLKAAEAAVALATLIRQGGPEAQQAFTMSLDRTRSQERSSAVQQILDKARKALSGG